MGLKESGVGSARGETELASGHSRQKQGKNRRESFGRKKWERGWAERQENRDQATNLEKATSSGESEGRGRKRAKWRSCSGRMDKRKSLQIRITSRKKSDGGGMIGMKRSRQKQNSLPNRMAKDARKKHKDKTGRTTLYNGNHRLSQGKERRGLHRSSQIAAGG